jgi:hypothetical protein
VIFGTLAGCTAEEPIGTLALAHYRHGIAGFRMACNQVPRR